MIEKKTLNLTVPASLLAEFDQVCRHYGHGKQKGMVLSAAILMFLKADPVEQGRCLKELAAAQIDTGVETMIRRCRAERAEKACARNGEQTSQIGGGPAQKPLAAKEAQDSVHVITKLPTLDDLEGTDQKP